MSVEKYLFEGRFVCQQGRKWNQIQSVSISTVEAYDLRSRT